jgi:hypothetical protein
MLCRASFKTSFQICMLPGIHFAVLGVIQLLIPDVFTWINLMDYVTELRHSWKLWGIT